ncbi:MAG: response regulator [Eubacteriales bacterium]|nr:response regulator [Eubacteriales bacterium]
MYVNVVIVDNAPELLDKLSGIFRGMDGVKLLGQFEEAVAVVEFVKENPVDMVFTDIVMPDISGISLAAELHKLPDPPAVVLMSSIPGFSLEAWKIRAFGFLEKPYTRAQVAGMVESWRKSKRAETTPDK